MTPTILITRPDPAGSQFSNQIKTRFGNALPVLISPVMHIEMMGALPDLSEIKTVIFTSRNGVSAFGVHSVRRDFKCYCVGDATARVARDTGFQAVSTKGAADDLVARIIKDDVTGPCLHIRGAFSRGDVANRLSDAGISTQEAILYQQVGTPLTADARAVLTGENPVILPLFSPKSADFLVKSGKFSAPLLVAAMSRNVNRALPERFAAKVVVAKEPTADAMLDAIAALIEHGKALEGVNLAQ